MASNDYLEYMLFESASDTLGLPDGVLFLHSDQSRKMEELCRGMSSLYHQKDYSQLQPPAFEYYETFEKGSGPDIARRSFSFKDREGRLLSLRYDMTTPIARMAAMKYELKDLPLRYSYVGDVYREQPLHKGKMRQIRQAGIELIGLKGPQADIEVIELLGKSLSMIDSDYRIVIGDIRIYEKIIGSLKPAVHQAEAIHTAMNKKDAVSLQIIFEKIPGAFQEKENLLSLTRFFGKTSEMRGKLKLGGDSLNQMTEETISLLNQLPDEIRSHIILDFGLIKDFSYYTSLTFEGYVSSAGYPVANGGRYDELFQSFGKDFPAVGFAVDLSCSL